VRLQFFDPAIEWLVAHEHPDARTLSGQPALADYQWEGKRRCLTFALSTSAFWTRARTLLRLAVYAAGGAEAGLISACRLRLLSP
jgi:hypothetical protein